MAWIAGAPQNKKLKKRRDKERARIAEDKRLAKLVRKGASAGAATPLKPMVRRSQEKIKTNPEMERAFKIIDSDRWSSPAKVSFRDEGYTYPYDGSKVHPGEPGTLRTRKERGSGFSFQSKIDDTITDTRSKDHVIKDARLKMLAREEAIARRVHKHGRSESWKKYSDDLRRKRKAKAAQKRNPNR